MGALAELRRPTGRRVSAHYLVDPRGTVYQLVDDGRAAWHAGDSRLDGRGAVNSRTLGVELVNAGDGETPFPAAQIAALAALLRHLLAAHRLKPDRILGHRDVAPGRKVDPADNFPWPALRALIGT